MITTIIVHLVTHLHVLMDIHLQLANVVHVEQYLELAINAIRPIFIAIHVQRDTQIRVLMDIHLKHLDVVHVARRHLEFAINAIRTMFITIHVQRGMYHLCLVLMDTHLQLR